MNHLHIINDAIDHFNYLVNHVASHTNVLNNNIYPQPSTYLTTHYICMKVAGFENIDFDFLTVISGASALFAYEPNEFMPKYAHMHIDIDKRIEEATGFGWEWLVPDTADECFDMIKESIDHEKPVKSTLYENILFVGYIDNENKKKRKFYVLSDGASYFNDWVNWKAFFHWFKEWGKTGLGRFTKRMDTLPEKEIATRFLNDLVNWADEPPEEVKKQYPKAIFGLKGMEEYANDCGNTQKYKDWRACHDINPQWVTIQSSAIFLKKLVDDNIFNADTNLHLKKSSELFMSSYQNWRIFYHYLGHVAPQKAGKNKNNRKNGASAIRKALAYEEQAINEIRTGIQLLKYH